MDNQAPLSQSIPEPVRPSDRKISRMAGRRGAPIPGRETVHPASEDWQPANGLVNRMLAYSDWWNIPSARSRGVARAQTP